MEKGSFTLGSLTFTMFIVLYILVPFSNNYIYTYMLHVAYYMHIYKDIILKTNFSKRFAMKYSRDLSFTHHFLANLQLNPIMREFFNPLIFDKVVSVRLKVLFLLRV